VREKNRVGCCCVGSVHPPSPKPRWATALHFVIPTGAQRSGGTCSFTFTHRRMCRGQIASGFRFSTNANCRSPFDFGPTASRGRRDDKVEGGGSPWHQQTWIDSQATKVPTLTQAVHLQLSINHKSRRLYRHILVEIALSHAESDLVRFAKIWARIVGCAVEIVFVLDAHRPVVTYAL
jgi:hypothetical protein